MGNKININSLTQYILDQNYIDFAFSNNYSYGAREWECTIKCILCSRTFERQ